MTDLGLAVQIFFREGEAKELRLLTREGVMSGFYDNRLKLGIAARDFGASAEDEGVTGVYWTLNPIDPSTLKYINNELRIRPTFATSAWNILKRSWLLIDVDPVRPSGMSATDAEKAAAFTVFTTVVDFLRSIGWPDPVEVDSGNGYHALYHVNLAPGDTEIVRNVLRGLAWKFDTAAAKVDKGVFDANRICKVPGTWARKGEDTPERPHRLSRILAVPKPIKTVSTTLLVGIAKYAPPPPAPSAVSAGAPRIGAKRAKEFFKTYEGAISVSHTEAKNASTFYYLNECPFNEGPHRDQREKTAVFIGKSGARFRCFSDDCSNYTFDDLLDLLEEKTGVRFDIAESDEEMERHWGGIEYVGAGEAGEDQTLPSEAR